MSDFLFQIYDSDNFVKSMFFIPFLLLFVYLGFNFKGWQLICKWVSQIHKSADINNLLDLPNSANVVLCEFEIWGPNIFCDLQIYTFSPYKYKKNIYKTTLRAF
jgi:hypothetical protein